MVLSLLSRARTKKFEDSIKVKAGHYMPRAALKQTEYIIDDFQTNLEDNQDTVGSILRSSRLARGEALEKVSRSLRISEVYLVALEDDNRARMPELVYTIGFLKTYALYLGLNAESMVNKFKEQFTQSIREETLVFPAPAAERSIPTSTLVTISTALAMLIIVSWLYLKPNKEVIDEFQHLSPVVTEDLTAEGVSSQDVKALEEKIEAIDKVEPVETPVVLEEKNAYSQAYPIFPIPDTRPYEETRAAKIKIQANNIYLGEGKSFIILAKDESWVEVKNNKGQVLLSKTLKAGESQELEAQPSLVFSTGNAGGISFYVNGKYYEGLGKAGEILRGKSIHFSQEPAEVE